MSMNKLMMLCGAKGHKIYNIYTSICNTPKFDIMSPFFQLCTMGKLLLGNRNIFLNIYVQWILYF